MKQDVDRNRDTRRRYLCTRRYSPGASLREPLLTRACLAEHLPAVLACPLLSLKAVYSRTQKSAEKLAQHSANVDAYFGSPSTLGCSLDDLLNRQDIGAVIIACPILVQPKLVKKAIRAGKHVLSEKPIAEDVATAVELLKWYKDSRREGMWSVGENFRFFGPIAFGAEQLRRLGGNVTTFSVRLYAFIDDDDPAYKTAWFV